MLGTHSLTFFYEWIECRVEKLTQGEETHRNTVAYAEVKVRREKEKYKKRLENEGILLAKKSSEKMAFKIILFLGCCYSFICNKIHYMYFNIILTVTVYFT